MRNPRMYLVTSQGHVALFRDIASAMGLPLNILDTSTIYEWTDSAPDSDKEIHDFASRIRDSNPSSIVVFHTHSYHLADPDIDMDSLRAAEIPFLTKRVAPKIPVILVVPNFTNANSLNLNRKAFNFIDKINLELGMNIPKNNPNADAILLKHIVAYVNRLFVVDGPEDVFYSNADESIHNLSALELFIEFLSYEKRQEFTVAPLFQADMSVVERIAEGLGKESLGFPVYNHAINVDAHKKLFRGKPVIYTRRVAQLNSLLAINDLALSYNNDLVLICSHLDLTQSELNRIRTTVNYKVVTTDSVGLLSPSTISENFHVLSLASLIAKALNEIENRTVV